MQNETGIEAFERYQAGKSGIQFLSLFGLSLVIFGLYITFTISLSGLLFYIPGFYILKKCTPYFIFGLTFWKLRHHKSEDDFAPLPKWLVRHANEEITGAEYEQLRTKGGLSPLGRIQFDELLEINKMITVYDLVNLLMMDEQIGWPSVDSAQDSIKKSMYK